jgi:hypothetical protein
VPLVARVSVDREAEAVTLDAADISAGGMRLCVAPGAMPGVQPGELVRVRLDLGSDRYGRPLDVDAEAEVVRVDLGGPDRRPGFAVMWRSTDPAVARQLAVILEYLESPD